MFFLLMPLPTGDGLDLGKALCGVGEEDNKPSCSSGFDLNRVIEPSLCWVIHQNFPAASMLVSCMPLMCLVWE